MPAAFGHAIAYVRRLPAEFWALAALAVASDARPFPARGSLRRFAAIFVSVTFTFAILLLWGAGPAIAVQTLALVAGAVRIRLSAERTIVLIVRFSLAFVAAAAVLSLPGSPSFGPGEHFSSADWLYLLGAAAAWFAVNYATLALWLGLRYRHSTRRIFTRTLAYEVLSTGALLFLAPLIVAAPTGWALLLAIVPVLAVNQLAWLYNRQDEQLRHDTLTGLLSRQAIMGGIHDLVVPQRGRPWEGKTRFALLLLDLDRFKQVNDTLGHATGDRLLAVVAQRLAGAVRGTDLVARLGGDEFAVAAMSVGDASTARSIAAHIAQSLGAPIDVDGHPLEITASIGVALYPEHGDDLETLMRHADVAMYEAKHRADPVAVYAPEFDHRSPLQLGLLADLRRALEDPEHRHEIAFHYQPQIALRTGRVEGVEALLRWRHPDRGVIDVAEILGVAEHTPVIRELTKRVVQDVVEQLARWKTTGIDQNASINVSMRDLDTPELAAYLGDTLERNGVAPHRLTMEITETAALADPGPALANLRQIARLGVRVSLDDFGTGYSSLVHLRRLPVSEVKIDRSFVRGVASDPEDVTIVRSIIALGNALDLRVVAEGVEDEKTATLLTEAGCHVAQGWYYAPAMPADGFVAWLSARGAR